jgi:hypothetical protein
MPVAVSQGAISGPALEEAIERHIRQRTWGRVHQLHVEVRDGRAHVRGCAPSYYVKQLAIQAVQELDDNLEFDAEIDVGPTAVWGADN